MDSKPIGQGSNPWGRAKLLILGIKQRTGHKAARRNWTLWEVEELPLPLINKKNKQLKQWMMEIVLSGTSESAKVKFVKTNVKSDFIKKIKKKFGKSK